MKDIDNKIAIKNIANELNIELNEPYWLSGNCPIQAEGYFKRKDEKSWWMFYFRSRGITRRVLITPVNDFVSHLHPYGIWSNRGFPTSPEKGLFIKEEIIGDANDPYVAGWESDKSSLTFLKISLCEWSKNELYSII